MSDQGLEARLATITGAYERLRLVVVAMRRAQKNYFKFRNQTDLRIARDYERRVDAELENNPLATLSPVQQSSFSFGEDKP